jgi:TatD DNase family protein
VIVDTHCHLNFNFYKEDLSDVLYRAKEAGIGRMVVPAIDLETSREVIDLSRDFSEIYAAVGVHPNEAKHFSPENIDTLRILAAGEKVVAIGEIGLDNYHKDVPIEKQIQVFNAQLQLAAELSLPVLIHNREADCEIEKCLTDWKSILEAMNSPLLNNSGILHAFSSDLDFAKKGITLGFQIGAAGPLTFRNASERQFTFQNLPLEKVIIETDSPFLSPHPFRGKRNEPANCVLIVKKLAELWHLSEEEVAKITTNNASRIFRWIELNQIN